MYTIRGNNPDESVCIELNYDARLFNGLLLSSNYSTTASQRESEAIQIWLTSTTFDSFYGYIFVRRTHPVRCRMVTDSSLQLEFSKFSKFNSIKRSPDSNRNKCLSVRQRRRTQSTRTPYRLISCVCTACARRQPIKRLQPAEFCGILLNRPRSCGTGHLDGSLLR